MKVSIVTATYNDAATIRDTIESVLSQDYPDIEYIIVDGNSTDGTMDVVQEYKGRVQHVLSEPDTGAYDAMNKGFRLATGDIIGVLNADDFFTAPTIVSRLVATLEESHADAVYGDVHYVHADNLEKVTRYYSSRLFRRSWMRFGFMPAHPSFYCRREIYLKYGLFDTSYKIAADFEQLLRLIFVNRIKTVYIPLDCVTMRTGGLSSSGMVSHKRIFREHLQALKANGVWSCSPLLALRYVYKIGELCISKITH